MESTLFEIIKEGGHVAIMAVIMTIGFGWTYIKVKNIESRLGDGDKIMDDFHNKIDEMAEDISFIRGLLEGREKKK